MQNKRTANSIRARTRFQTVALTLFHTPPQIMHDAGLTVSNPALALPSYHVQSDDERPSAVSNEHSYVGKGQVPGALRYVPLSDQWLF